MKCQVLQWPPVWRACKLGHRQSILSHVVWNLHMLWANFDCVCANSLSGLADNPALTWR